jgi:hypothetical protein
MRARISQLHRSSRLAIVAAVLAAGGAAPLAQVAEAGTDGQLSGNFQFAGKAVLGCPIGALLCTSGTFTGDVSAPFQFSILTLTPSATLGVFYFDGKLTLHTTKGTSAATSMAR